MGTLTSRTVNNVITNGKDETYYTIRRDNGDLVASTYDYTEAQNYLRYANQADAEDKANAADGDSVEKDDTQEIKEQESMPTLSPTEDDEAPENKGDLMLSGQDTNSFATDKAKSYPSTESADQKTDSSNKVDASTITKVDINAMSAEAPKVNVKSLATAAGGIQNASADITAAASEASLTSAAEIVAEYTTKFISLPLSIPGKIAEKTAERFNKSKGDKDKNGNEYNPVKIDMGEAMKKFVTPNESLTEEESKKDDEKNKNKVIDKTQEKAKKAKESVSKIIDKSSETLGEIMTHTLEGIKWVQENVNKELSRAENNVRKELNNAYVQAEKDVDNFCEGEGEKIAVRLIKQYNKTIEDAAKNVVDKQNKAKSKATIKGKAAIQKAKLKIFAMLGL